METRILLEADIDPCYTLLIGHTVYNTVFTFLINKGNSSYNKLVFILVNAFQSIHTTDW